MDGVACWLVLAKYKNNTYVFGSVEEFLLIVSPVPKVRVPHYLLKETNHLWLICDKII